jgi:nitroreductase
MDIMTVMETRHSVRQYKSQTIEPEKREQMNALCRECNEQSGLHIQIIYDEPKCFDSFLAHYGHFAGVTNYIAIVGQKEEELDEKAGYYGEKLVLKAQELGLNTCWVAMTHGKSRAVIGKGEKLAIIISMGYGENQGTVHHNKPVEQLVKGKNNSPEWFQKGVRAALLAPTAMNQQKFQIERIGDMARITAPKGILTKLDLGIVKYHFEVASGHKAV